MVNGEVSPPAALLTPSLKSDRVYFMYCAATRSHDSFRGDSSYARCA
jgi:hypothetical protein